MNAPPDERVRIRQAMERILGGTLRSSTGALTIVAVVQEADVLALIRVINQLTVEITELREALETLPANVIPLRPREP